MQSVDLACKAKLKELLVTYKKHLVEKEMSSMTSTVGCAKCFFLEFGWVQIMQVLRSCDKLFTVEDVLEHVEIWRRHHAIAILVAIAEVFGDIAIENDMPVLSESTIDIEMDWKFIYRLLLP